VIMKKLCKQEVIGIRMHQFKVKNSIQLICDSYSTSGLKYLNVEIGITN